MQLDSVCYQPLTRAERQRRQDNNLCLYCGAPGHRVSNCPRKVYSAPRFQQVDNNQSRSSFNILTRILSGTSVQRLWIS